MPIIRIGPCGSVGVVKDLSSSELKNEAWTDARNIRFLDGSAYQSLGHGEIYTGPSVIPYHVLPAYVGSDRHWIYAGASKVYGVTAASGSVVHTNLTKQVAAVDVDYAATPNQWTSTSLSGIPVLNPGNTSQPPQYWPLTGRLADLPGWPATTFAKSIRAYKSQLVALNVTEGGVNYPYMVRWSHPAVPGAVTGAGDWDYTDATKDAGRTDLAEGGDPVMDGLQLGGTFVIYKEKSVWRMDYTGGPFVNAFTKVLGTSGAMNRNCIVEIDGRHVVLTNDDVLVHDGQSAQSVLDKQARRALLQAIDAQSVGRCFVFKNPFLNEVLVAYPEGGNTIPNLALVWNYKDNTVSYREMPSIHHANFGPVESGISQPWSADSAPWGSDVSSWNAAEYTPDASRVVMAANGQKLLLLDSSTTFDGALPTVLLERRGLSLGKPDLRKLVRGVRPRVQGSAGETITVEIGQASDPYSDPTYTALMTFTIGSDAPCDCMVDGRFIAVRFSGGTAYQSRLDGFDLDVEYGGAF